MRATIFFLTFVVFVAALVLRVDQVLFGDKLATGEAQSRAQMASLSQALSTEVQSLRDILILSFSEIEQIKGDYPTGRPYSRFHMIAKLAAPAPKEDRPDWQIQSAYFGDKSNVKSWATPYITLALKSVQAGDIRSGSSDFFVLMDSQRQPFLLMLYNASGTWYAGLLGPEAFQALMDRQKGQKSTVFVVNTQGQALAHTIQEYIGSLLTEDPLVGELMKSSTGSGFGSFPDLKGESVQGLYEQVAGTNLYAVITTQMKVLMSGRESTRMQLALLGAGLALIGMAVFFLSDRGSAARSAQFQKPPVIAPLTPVPASFNSMQVANAVNSGADRMKAYVQVASSLSHELKSPLTSILGYSQLAMNQMPEGGPKEHLQKIDAEARAAREIIQKLLVFAGEDKVAQQKVSLESVVTKSLKNLEGKILSKGIKLTKNFQPVPPFLMPVDLLVRAVESIILNSIEAMERAPKKELNITMNAEGETVYLVIEDTGEGISAANLPKIFDPFFTTRSSAQHVGLGLSTAMGILKEVFGELQVDSEQGKGTKVSVRFSPQAASEASLSTIPSIGTGIPVQELKIPSSIAAREHTQAEVEIAPLDPLVVDNSIERLIEDEVPDMPAAPTDGFKLDMSAEAPKAPKAPAATLPPVSSPTQATALLPELDSAPAFPKAPIEDDFLSLDLDLPPPSLSEAAPPAPAPKAAPAAPEKPAFSAKIDKPKIDLKKKTSRVDEEVQIAIRRPGERT